MNQQCWPANSRQRETHVEKRRRITGAKSGSRSAPCASVGAFACVVLAAVQAVAAPVVTVAKAPAQEMTYGMDFERLWDWDRLRPEEKKRISELAVKECQVHYVRVAINPLAEQLEGQFEPAHYDQILDMMTHVKAARPDIQFFGSPRPIGEVDWSRRKLVPYTCFPFWITKFTPETDEERSKTNPWKPFEGVDTEKAADYLVRYVRFMKSKGMEIAYLDVKNELDRLIAPPEGKAMALRIRAALGAECPRLMVPSSLSSTGTTKWLQESLDSLGTDYFDIASFHLAESLEETAALARKAGKPLWVTEMHCWRGPDSDAATNTVNLLYLIRTGVGGINDWLSLGNEKKDYKMFRALDDGSLAVMRVYYIYKQLVNTSGGGNYVPTDIPEGLASTAAFVRGNLMTVWLINAGDKPLKGVAVNLGGRKVWSPRIRTVWWGPDNPREGSSGTLDVAVGSESFACDVAPLTLVCYEFDVN